VQLNNYTPYQVDSAFYYDKEGREHLLVLAKATWRLPLSGQSAELSEHQVPLIDSDTATAQPGLSSPEYESEYVPFKSSCDVLVLCCAYAPKGTPSSRVSVGVRVGGMSKTFTVTGRRKWQTGLLGVTISMTEPKPFIKQAISYDIAFGSKCFTALNSNPIGIGHYASFSKADGQDAPQIELIDKPPTDPSKSYPSLSFGPIGRSWEPRAAWAGTYDESWRKDRSPLLPKDFDTRYFQCAPKDQQVHQLLTDDQVTLINLVNPILAPSGRIDFKLPDLSLEGSIQYKSDEIKALSMNADTLLIEPDKQRFMVTWRAAIPLGRRSIHSVAEINIGKESTKLVQGHNAVISMALMRQQLGLPDKDE
jgi:hypothetical protein